MSALVWSLTAELSGGLVDEFKRTKIKDEQDYALMILARTTKSGERIGQALFNSLPSKGANLLCNTHLDTFNVENMHFTEVYMWLKQHVILEDGEVIAIFDGSTIIWQKSQQEKD